MVGPLLILGAGALAWKAGLLGKGTKGGKIFDLTKGPVGDVVLGMGSGAVVNKLDAMTGGHLQRLYIGSPEKGKNINATDGVVLATTVGLGGLGKKNLMKTAAIIGGKKLGEFSGAIDPIDLTGLQDAMSPSSGFNQMGVRNY